jgi:hypothetical protein
MQKEPQTIYEWYQLSREQGPFLMQIRDLDENRVRALAAREKDLVGEGRLRTRRELEMLHRTRPPALEELKLRPPDEQTLQWCFLDRRYLSSPTERVLYREFPSGRWGETLDGKGRSDLLAFDRDYSEPILVELKRASSTMPLSAAVMEILYHWSFHQKFLLSFKALLHSYACTASAATRLVIAAPDEYFRKARRRSQDRSTELGGEYDRALSWINALRETVRIDIYAIEDQWLAKAPTFQMKELAIENG